MGVALVGAIVLSGLATAFVTNVSEDERISAEVSTQVGVAVQGEVDFVSSDQIAAAAKEAGLDAASTEALVDNYEQAQLFSLKAGLLVAALLAGLSLAFTRDLPSRSPRAQRSGAQPALSSEP
jgi:hypothetical protein